MGEYTLPTLPPLPNCLAYRHPRAATPPATRRRCQVADQGAHTWNLGLPYYLSHLFTASRFKPRPIIFGSRSYLIFGSLPKSFGSLPKSFGSSPAAAQKFRQPAGKFRFRFLKRDDFLKRKTLFVSMFLVSEFDLVSGI